MIVLTIITQSAFCQTQHNTWLGNPYFASLTALRLIIACRWRTNVRWKCLHSILLAEPLPTKDLHKVSADLCLLIELLAWVLGPSCQSWPMCSICGWYWNCSQYCYGSYPKHLGSLQVYSPGRIETDDRKLPLWSQASSIPGQNHFIRGSIATNSQDSKFLNKLRFPKSKKSFAAVSGVRKLIQILYSQIGWKAQPILQTFENRSPNQYHIRIERNPFDSVNKALSDTCELALKQPIPGKKLVLMTDASFRSAGYALMVEDNPHQKIQSKRKTYAPVAFGSKIFSPAQLKMSIYSKEFLPIYMAIPKFAHILWEGNQQSFWLTTNPSHDSSGPKPFHHPCGTHVIMCCSSTLK